MVWSKRIQSKVKQSGFTVIEMVITIAVFVSLVLVGSIELETYKDKLVLDNTVKVVESSIEQAARVATLRNETIMIRYMPYSKKVSIVGQSYSREFKIDSKIDIYYLSDLKISKNGSIPPHTISITNHENTKEVKLQMTWGRAIDNK